jgi:Fe-S oxidoreductase
MDNFNDKKSKALKVISEPQDSKLVTYLNSCVHCGLCAESCMYYLSTKDEQFIPTRKVDLISSIYQRYCTFTGKYFPGLTNARELNEELTTEMTDQLFGACTLCGRCSKHCSIGIDIAYLVREGRKMLSEMELVPANLQSTINAALQTGNNMSIPAEELKDTLSWLEDELKDEVNDPDASIPLNVPNVNVLYTLNPREPKFFPLSISAMVKIFYAAKESWTLSTSMYDVTNYAYFTSNNDEAKIITQRLYDEVLKLNAKRCILAECGHGSRAFRWEGPNYLKKTYPFDVITSVELLAEYISQGRLKLDKEKNKELMTLHDPCNLVREGGVIDQQRYVLKHAAGRFVEMTPCGTDNFCCGGGGGMLAMSEYNERRMKIAEIKADQIRKTGASVVVTPCHNCVDQLMQIDNKFKLGVQIKTLSEVVADAIILEKK